MLTINNPNQQELFDPWSHITPKRKKLLENSWAGLFRNEILPALPVAKLAPYFCSNNGRPTKELYTTLGIFILQQTFDFTDIETIEQLAFNTQWHYALNITEESDSAKYFSPKTLWNMHELVSKNNLAEILFDCVTNKLADTFNVNTDYQRIDSVHIKSNMKRLGRIRIFSNTTIKFITNLKRKYREEYDQIDCEIIDRYLSSDTSSYFSDVKPSESQKTLTVVANDLFNLIQQFKSNKNVKRMNSFKLLQRVLTEQCNISGEDEGKKVDVKKPKEIPSDSLQNPSDPDASYSGHKGQGYQVQIMETFTTTENSDEKKSTLNLITHVEVETACLSDAHALKPAIVSVKNKKLCAEEIQADTLYGSDANHEYALENGIDLVSPAKPMSSKCKNDISDFIFLDNGHVKSCPNGCKPLFSKNKKGKFTEGFCMEACFYCSLLPGCPVKPGKENYVLRYEAKTMRLAKRRAYERTKEFKERYRWRAGVEATMSELKTKTGIKRLRVRGLKAVKFAVFLKVAGLNILRATAAKKGRDAKYRDALNYFFDQIVIFGLIKSTCQKTLKILFRIRHKILPNYIFVT